MDESIRTSVKARIYKKISKNLSDYCIYLCSSSDFDSIPSSIKKEGKKCYITIVGTNLPAIESVDIEYFGTWVSNKKYGLQFKADSYSLIKPTTEKGIVSFLKSKAFPGIGEKTAKLIVFSFGVDTLNVIKEEPKKLLTVPGITLGKLSQIEKAYKENESYSNLAIFLGAYGFSSDSIIRINKSLGPDAVLKIKDNPYILEDIKGIGFKSCDKIAKSLDVSLDSKERIKGCILECIKTHIMTSGDTCILYEDLERSVLSILNENDCALVSSSKVKEVLKLMQENSEIVFRSKRYVFLSEYDNAEEYAAEKIVNLKDKKSTFLPMDILFYVREYQSNSEIKITEKQTEAVITALENRVSIITGGPGTGKTTIMSAIIYCYKKLCEKSVVLLAPTGKAARRMHEATGVDASTIHSKIHIYDSSLDIVPENLPEGLIVVDEASMVDGLLFSKLLKAVGTGDYQLLLIGDIDQLPSVGAGSVLYDLITSNVLPVVKLTEVFRQKDGGSIIENANNINSGNKSLTLDNDFEIIEVSSEDEALEKIRDCYLKETKEKGIENVALLSPLRRSQNGRFKVVSDELNTQIQNAINPKIPGKCCSLSNYEYRVGDRVLQWKNTQVTSNGDIGVIMDILEDNGDICIKIQWDNGNITFEDRQSMNDITLAYAISIHKSQGSEYLSVIIPILSEHDCKLYKRQLLYTGITRAKQHAILIGNIKAINSCIERCDSNTRTTLLSERLKYYDSKSSLS